MSAHVKTGISGKLSVILECCYVQSFTGRMKFSSSLSHNFTGWQPVGILLFYFKPLLFLTDQSAPWHITLDAQFIKYFSFMSVFLSTLAVSISHRWYNAVHIMEITAKCVLFCVSSGSFNFAVCFISL